MSDEPSSKPPAGPTPTPIITPPSIPIEVAPPQKPPQPFPLAEGVVVAPMAEDTGKRRLTRTLPPPGVPAVSGPAGSGPAAGPPGAHGPQGAQGVMSGDLADPISHEMVMAVSRFLRPARALPDDAVQPLRGDVLLAYDNVVRGVDAVLPHEPHLREALPLVDFRVLRELPQLALATSFAAAQVDKQARGQVAPLLARAVHLRRLLLAAAEMLVLSGDFANTQLEKIRRGSGPADTARDCIDLATLFRQQEGARKKTVLTDELLGEAQELGAHLLQLVAVRPSRRKTTLAPSDPSVQLRDRLWTLLNLRHRELRRVGMWLFMDDVDERVPRLLARATDGRVGGTTKPEL
jgi:hypothetical protein